MLRSSSSTPQFLEAKRGLFTNHPRGFTFLQDAIITENLGLTPTGVLVQEMLTVMEKDLRRIQG